MEGEGDEDGAPGARNNGGDATALIGVGAAGSWSALFVAGCSAGCFVGSDSDGSHGGGTGDRCVGTWNS